MLILASGGVPLANGHTLLGVAPSYPAYVATVHYAADFIAAAGITDATQQQALRQLETTLLAAGLLDPYDRTLSRLHVWYPVVGGTSAQHALNFVDPGKFALNFVGSPVHSQAGGIAWNGVNQHADTGFTPFDELGENPPAGLSLHYYSLDNTPQGDVYEIGTYGTYQMLIAVQSGAFNGAPFARAYSNTPNLIGTGADGRGLFSVNRTITNTGIDGIATLYKNGVQLVTDHSGGYLPTTSIYLGGLNINDSYVYGYSNRRCAGAGISVCLTATQTRALYAAVQQFNTTLNRAV